MDAPNPPNIKSQASGNILVNQGGGTRLILGRSDYAYIPVPLLTVRVIGRGEARPRNRLSASGDAVQFQADCGQKALEGTPRGDARSPLRRKLFVKTKLRGVLTALCTPWRLRISATKFG